MTTTPPDDAQNLAAHVRQKLLEALKAPLITYLTGVKANPTIQTITAGLPAVAANELANSPALQSEIITDVADLLLSHLHAAGTAADTPVSVTPTVAEVVTPGA